uniref:Ig-like domain-containing protein n=1 Tax=Ficedula albicollis TaxID=59894 RepID=A0A803WDR2_FICAL
ILSPAQGLAELQTPWQLRAGRVVVCQDTGALVALAGHGELLPSNNTYGWYQQKVPGSGPVTVIYYNDRRPSGIPSRFSRSTGTLTITGVQAKDEAVYFCGGKDSSSSASTVACSSWGSDAKTSCCCRYQSGVSAVLV